MPWNRESVEGASYESVESWNTEFVVFVGLVMARAVRRLARVPDRGNSTTTARTNPNVSTNKCC